MGRLLGLVVLVLDIIAILDIIRSAKDTGRKALWIILVLILPLVGMCAYFLVGKKK